VQAGQGKAWQNTTGRARHAGNQGKHAGLVRQAGRQGFARQAGWQDRERQAEWDGQGRQIGPCKARQGKAGKAR
jgi:hypothetical protein